MISEAIAIHSSATIQASKVIYIRRAGAVGLIISDGRNAQGRWHIIDMAFGNVQEAISDLRREGYMIKEF